MFDYISFSNPLIENSKNFLKIKKVTPIESLKYLFKKAIFVGWGRKKSGLLAVRFSRLTKNRFLLLEDGFIRSFGLGVEGSPSFSIVKDDVGVYYDASTQSKLENILNSYDFKSDIELMRRAKEAKELIVKYQISKYNKFEDVDLTYLDDNREKVLIVAQTAGDSSLKYGFGDRFTTKEMIDDAIRENPKHSIYIKIHPDVICGKKRSDIELKDIPKECYIINKSINPLKLLRYFDKVYTKTSGMGMEALLLNREVHCYGVPFYAGWGVTKDRLKCKRRDRELETNEIFAGAYILYSEYFNPFTYKKSDIIDTIRYIKDKKR
jgi:capsular polysaccharide export protein